MSPFSPFPMLLIRIDTTEGFLLMKKSLFNTGIGGEGLLHNLRMTYLSKMTVISTYFVEGCSKKKQCLV